MRNLLRRLRGMLGLGAAWALGWVPVGALFGRWMFLTWPFPFDLSLTDSVIAGAKIFGAMGFAGGGIFSGALRLSEGRRNFEQLAIPRFAGLGAVGGFVLGGLTFLSG